MGNIVIYGLCGEKRCAKGRQDKAVFGGALGCHVSATIPGTVHRGSWTTVRLAVKNF